jgi:hypothetical protein
MTSAFIGKMPVASKLLQIVFSLNEEFQALQKSRKKSPFLRNTSPWLW